MADDPKKPILNIGPFNRFKRNYLGYNNGVQDNIISNNLDSGSINLSDCKSPLENTSDLNTSKNANLLSLCSVIEDEVFQLRKVEEQKELLLESVKRLEIEKTELNQKCSKYEIELANRDSKVRDYELRLRMNHDESKIASARESHSYSICKLKQSITKLQDENKQLRSICKNIHIIKEKADHDQTYISRLENQINEYKSFIDQDRDKLKEELESTKNTSKLHETEAKNFKQENTSLKSSLDELINTLRIKDAKTVDQAAEIASLRNELSHLKKRLVESEALRNRAILSKESYKKILTSYDNLNVNETFIERSLVERCKNLENVVMELDEQCDKLEVSNSILRFSANEEKKNVTNNTCQHCLQLINQPLLEIPEVQKVNRVLHLKNNPHEIHEKTVTKQLEESIELNDQLHSIIKSLREEIENKNYFKDLKKFTSIMQKINKIPTTSKYLEMSEEATKNKKLAARMKQACVEKIHSFRSDYTKLLGYGIEYDTKDNMVRLISLYSQKPEDVLLFKKTSETKNFELLQNQFSDDMQHLVSVYKDLPALTSAINLELYKLSKSEVA